MLTGFVIPPPNEVHVTNWYEDPFSFGSYSYISTEQNYDDPIYLSEPVHDRILFAGEATSTDAYGYTHSALLSARREVVRLLYVNELMTSQEEEEEERSTSRSTKTVSVKSLIVLSIAFIMKKIR